MRVVPVLLILVAAALLAFTASHIGTPNAQGPTVSPEFSFPDDFGDYWYQGEAELTSYRLEQARYGEIHDGSAVLIYVTEDFSRSKHVKLDNPSEAGDDAVKVLKLNSTRKFNTGIYPYSMMTSVFTPVYRADDGPTLKVTTSSQEWCGHTFTQLNRRGDGVHVLQRSYFESEGDIEKTLDAAIMEDDLWTLIRLDPAVLPTGEFSMIPGGIYNRLGHAEWKAFSATASFAESEDPETRIYRIEYPDLPRTLEIEFRSEFPHEVEGWREERPSGWGEGREMLTTKATRIERIMLDYWNYNSVKDEEVRKRLALDVGEALPAG